MGARRQSGIDNNGALYKVSQSGEREHLEWFHHKKKNTDQGLALQVQEVSLISSITKERKEGRETERENDV